MLGGTRAACAHQLTVQGHREEIEAPQRLEQLAGEFLDVGQAAPLRGSTLRYRRGNLSNRAMAIDMLHKGQLGRVETHPPIRPENFGVGKYRAINRRRGAIR